MSRAVAPSPSSSAPRLSRVEREALAVANDPILKHMLDEERVEADQVDTALLRRLLGYLRPHRLLATGSVLLATLEAVLMTVPAYLIGVAVDRVATDEPAENALARCPTPRRPSSASSGPWWR
jgi:hypothetical protein